jgi:hypothetical protein
MRTTPFQGVPPSNDAILPKGCIAFFHALDRKLVAVQSLLSVKAFFDAYRFAHRDAARL